ncbi:hypothetical protein PCA_12285 [Rhodanobacter sp. PCA2]|nr:hypothetical protein [Rhodanobacter sp. PCA2]
MSKTGLTLCFLYLVIVGLCALASLGSSGDPKGEFVLLQLPLALQLAALDWLGLSRALSNLPWAGAYLLVGLSTLALLYGLGWGLGKLFGWATSWGRSRAP